jgi:cytochrome c-type biogenesis protein CcmH
MVQTALLCVITFAMLGAGRSQYDRIGHEMVCQCGCGQILVECNHVGCPVSPVMIAELQARIAQGGPDNLIFNWFIAKYGAVVLAAPMRGGFDNAAWIVPIAVFLLATAGTFVVVWMWKRRALQLAGGVIGDVPVTGPSNPQDAALRERIRRETEY